MLAVIPGVDDVLIVDSNSMRNRLEIDVLTNLKRETIKEARTGCLAMRLTNLQ